MSRAKVILIVGSRFSGKSRFVEQFLPMLRAEGLVPTGFFQRGIFDEEGSKIGYDLVSAEDGTCIPLARRTGTDSPWQFDEAAFARAEEMLTEGADVCILDEIGPLELSGAGHAQTLEAALKMQSAVIIVVREELAEELRARLPAEREVFVIQFKPADQEALSQQILEILLS